MKIEWILCPFCGSKTRLKIRYDTVLENFPLYCPKCKHETLITVIMDEPTNHLDVQAKEALKSALMDFAGTVLLVSHEEAFYREWAQRVISVEK